MAEMRPTTQPGYNLSTGDLARVRVGPTQAARLIAEYYPPGEQERRADPAALLLSLLKGMQRNNQFWTVTSWAFQGLGLPMIQQILPQALDRQALYMVFDAGVGGQPFIIFETGPLVQTTLSVNDFNAFTKRGLRFGNLSLTAQEFRKIPTNPITLIVSAGSTAAGKIFEGFPS